MTRAEKQRKEVAEMIAIRNNPLTYSGVNHLVYEQLASQSTLLPEDRFTLALSMAKTILQELQGVVKEYITKRVGEELAAKGELT